MMSKEKLLTFVCILGLTFNYFNKCGSSFILEIEGSVESDGHNEKCLMNMMKKNFKINVTVTIFLSNDSENSQMESNLIKYIFNSLGCSVYLYTQMLQKRMTPVGVKRNFLIILGKKSLKVTLGVLHSFYIWDSKAVFLVVTENLKTQKRIVFESVDNNTKINELTFKVMVEHVYLNSKLEPITEHYVSNPSKQYHAKKAYEKLTKIGSCNYGSVNKTPRQLSSKKEFVKKLTVGAIHAPPFSFLSQPDNRLTGSETILVSTIAEKLNITVSYKYYSSVDNLGDVHISDGHDIYGSGMLNDLLLNNIDIAVGNIIISDRVHQNLAVSTPYAVDRLTWILPEARLVFKFSFFPFIFDYKLTIFLISMYWIYPYLAFITTNYFHKASNDECSRYRTFRGTCITYFAMSTGSTVDIYPKTIRMKFFLFIWLFYTYHLNMYFSSTLIWFFAGKQYGPTLETIDDLLASGMDLAVDKRTHNYFKDHFNLLGYVTENDRTVYKTLVHCNSTNVCLSKIVRDRNLSMTLSHNYFSYAKHMFKDENGKFLLAALPGTIVSVPIGIIFKKGFVLHRKINVMVLRINEAGLFNYWSDKTNQELKTKHIVSTEPENDGIDANYSLKYCDLQLVFFSMMVELFGCFLVFIGELITYRWKKSVRITKCKESNEQALFDYVN